jgi:predicted RNA-binding Zn ribbon-like protein
LANEWRSSKPRLALLLRLNGVTQGDQGDAKSEEEAVAQRDARRSSFLNLARRLQSPLDLPRTSSPQLLLNEAQQMHHSDLPFVPVTCCAAEQPAEAQAALRRAKELREAIYQVFSATAAGRTPETAGLHALQTAYAAAAGHARIVAQADAYRWSWPVSPPNLDDLLWPVAFSAVELLTSPQVHRVKECPGSNDCGWLFFDESKNGSRRWCSMETCGSRSKMRRHYARQRAANLTTDM